MVPSSPSPRYYLLGLVLAGIGALLLAMWAYLHRPWERRERPLLIAGVAVLAIGVVLLGLGWWMGVQFARAENTNTLTYDLSVRMNGTGPVIVLLPAPVDARFYPALNATNGSSTLRVSVTSPDASVVVMAYGNVTFQIQAAVYPAGNNSYTRTAAPSSGYISGSANASIELDAANASAEVRVTLYAVISLGACAIHYLTVETYVHTGVRLYAVRYGWAFCQPRPWSRTRVAPPGLCAGHIRQNDCRPRGQADGAGIAQVAAASGDDVVMGDIEGRFIAGGLSKIEGRV